MTAGADDSSGLMAFWADFEPADLLEFQRWHNCEHVTERVSIPGFLVGRRYRNGGSGPMMLMMYETGTPAVLGSEAYLAALNNPTPWTRRALQWFRNPSRAIYRLIAGAGRPAPTEAPFVLAARFNLDPEHEQESVAAYRERILPAAAAADAVFRSRLYAVDEEISNIMTSERRIYGGGPGEQRYLLMHDCEREDIVLAPEPEGIGAEAELQAAHRDLYVDRLWLEFALRAPAEKG